MKPAPLELERPHEIATVLELLAKHGEDAKLIAGGQSLTPLLNLRMARPALLIDLGLVRELRGIERTESGVRIGAMTSHHETMTSDIVARHAPLLPVALRNVGHFQTRFRGTVGGSLAHADPAAELPLVMATLDATLHILSKSGSRTLRVSEFLTGALTTDLAPDELLVDITVPAAPPDARVAFREYARRHGDFAIAAAAVQFAPGTSGLLAGIGGVAATPHVCNRLSAAIANGKRNLRSLEAAAQREVQNLEALFDLQADADYRKLLAVTALSDCLASVLPR